MPQFHVNDIKSNTESYARAYLFYIKFTEDHGGLDKTKTSYLVRSSSLPEGTIDAIEVPWQGQVYKFASTHTIPEWTCSFNMDEKSDLRKNMLTWQKKAHNLADNIQGHPDEYFGEAQLELLDVKGSVILTYTLFQIWPSSVGAIELGYDNKDTVQFDVTFQFNWYEVDGVH